ncbi:MAG TPA: HAD-IA family hydrolase [Alphaproteobacteria bacterium]|jgi:phosphoglycolate phosphatase
MSQPLRAIIFDLDGTLIDSAIELTAAVNGGLAHYKLPLVTVSQVKTMIGDGAMALTERAFAASGRRLNGAALAEALEVVRVEYTSQPPSGFYPGARETLERLAAMGLPLAVCTNKPEKAAKRILGQLGATQLFRAIAGGDTFATKKPDPGPLQALMEQLGTSADETIMVGDGANDVIAGRIAGLFTVAVSYGYSNTPPKELGADCLVDSLEELFTVLAGRLPA